jgi:hypothetical protein
MKKILYSALIITSMIGFTSCLKDKGTYTEFNDAKENLIVEIVEATQSNNVPYDPVTFAPPSQPVNQALAGEPLPVIEDFDAIRVRVGGQTTALNNKSVNYSLVLAPALVNDYNTYHATNFLQLPATAYTLTGLTGVIPAGSNEALIKLRIDKSTLSLSNSYAIGLRLSSADGIINENAKNIVVTFSIKNKWDGCYKVTVNSYVDAVFSAFTPFSPQEFCLITTGPTSNDVENSGLGFPGYIFSNAGAPTYYGNFGLRINFNPANSTIASVTNYYGQPSPNTRSAFLDPTGLNNVLASKDINIKYVMTQSSSGYPNPSNPRSKFDEFWKYDRPR